MDSLTVKQLEAAQLTAKDCPPLEIASKLGISTKTLQRWSKKSAFQDFLGEVRRKTREKTAEILTNDLSTNLEELAQEHLKAHQTVRRLAEKAIDVLGNRNPDEINMRELAVWSQVLARHTEGERTASSLAYLDINKAIATVTRAGYVVSERETDDNPLQSIVDEP
jgi:transcriptional regulator with XRE-family HTH domain